MVSPLQKMHGGASGITFAVSLQTSTALRHAVLKVAPAGLDPVGNRDVLRQAAIQRALASESRLPVAPILFLAAGESLDDPPFYAMGRVEGECYEPLLDLVEQPIGVAELNERSRTLIDAMVELHRAPPKRIWSQEQAPILLADEVETWRRALASVRPGDVEQDDSALAEEAAARLLGTVPADVPPVVVHGDLRLGNALFARTTLEAVIDWEICRIGHPLLDLAWMCSFLDPTSLVTRVREIPGLVDPASLALRYAHASGTDVSDLAWFTALVCFKQAAATALIVKNNRRRPDPDPHLITLGPKVSAYLDRVLALVPSTAIGLTGPHHKEVT